MSVTIIGGDPGAGGGTPEGRALDALAAWRDRCRSLLEEVAGDLRRLAPAAGDPGHRLDAAALGRAAVRLEETMDAVLGAATPWRDDALDDPLTAEPARAADPPAVAAAAAPEADPGPTPRECRERADRTAEEVAAPADAGRDALLAGMAESLDGWAPSWEAAGGDPTRALTAVGRA